MTTHTELERSRGVFHPGPGELARLGESMHGFAASLFPLCRSITGDGVRETLRAIATRIPLTVQEVPTGTPAFDWTVPNEWNLRTAWIKDPLGRTIVDAGRCNLHVMGYSVPVRRRMTLDELRPKLLSLSDKPDLVPYRTSYYREDWAFCVPHRLLESLEPGEYEVCIDSTLRPGHLTYGECLLPGESADEVLLSCHVCHPSLANDNLSGIALATHLAEVLGSSGRRRLSYRFLFIPGTIGSIVWLSRNEQRVGRICAGLVLSCVGDAGKPNYKRSRRGDADIDRAVEHVLRMSGSAYGVSDFIPYGYDERQYCSPGFDLPVGCFTRSPNGAFPEYHTSADDLQLIRPAALADSLARVLGVVEVLEHNRRYRNLNPKCEPQLGKRGLYRAIGGQDMAQLSMALLWVLNLSDGRNDLLSIAGRAGLPFELVNAATQRLAEAGLLEPCEAG